MQGLEEGLCDKFRENLAHLTKSEKRNAERAIRQKKTAALPDGREGTGRAWNGMLRKKCI